MADKPKTQHAVAARDFRDGHGEGAVTYSKGDVIRDLAANQFKDWESVGLVRAAKPEEVKPAA